MTRIAALVIALPFAVVEVAPGDAHYIGPLQAEVHDRPSDSSEIKFMIAIGRKVIEFGREGEWVMVGIDMSGGRDGWIRARDLSPTDPDGLRY